MGGDQRGLPVAALRQFAIAGDDKYATRVVIAFRCQRNAYRHGQTMAQCAGIELNTRRLVLHRMSRQMRVGVLIGCQPVNGNKACFGQHAVVTTDSVPLRLNIDIAVVALFSRRGAVKDAKIEGGQKFDL